MAASAAIVRTMDVRQAARDLAAEGLDVTEWRDDPNATYDEHSHPGREVRVVISGEMTIRTDRGDRVLGPGDRLDLEPDETHSAVVGPEGVHYLAGTSR